MALALDSICFCEPAADPKAIARIAWKKALHGDWHSSGTRIHSSSNDAVNSEQPGSVPIIIAQMSETTAHILFSSFDSIFNSYYELVRSEKAEFALKPFGVFDSGAGPSSSPKPFKDRAKAAKARVLLQLATGQQALAIHFVEFNDEIGVGLGKTRSKLMAASELMSIISCRYPLQPARLRRFSKTSPGRCDSGFFSALPTISNIFAEKSDRTPMARQGADDGWRG